ncbi:MAG: alkaline shock response membrane anchor protein AmaP [Clostridia bacterium]
MMKMHWYDRILIALSGLLLIAEGAMVAWAAFNVQPIWWNVPSWIWTGDIYIVSCCTLSVLLLAWGVYLLCYPFRREKKIQYFEVANVQHGSLRISVQALDHLIQKCLARHPELTETTAKISGKEDRISVELRTSLLSDANIPRVVEALQAEIKQYLCACAGIQVETVGVIVEQTKGELSNRLVGSGMPETAPVAVMEPTTQSMTEPAVVEAEQPENAVPINGAEDEEHA